MQNIKNRIPAKFKLKIKQFMLDHFDGYSTKSYSQEGEDMVLRKIFQYLEAGFYVDIGAHHPKRFSNTFYFYKRGWRGINIDARPGSMKDFNKIRSRDINIEAAIDSVQRELTYYMFDEPALNTFDSELADSRNGGWYKLIEKKSIITNRLDALLHQHMPNSQTINFMTIDVEGMDLNVLESNDWRLFRPDYLLVENAQSNLNNLQNDDIYIFMRRNNYDFFAKTVTTMIYRATDAEI